MVSHPELIFLLLQMVYHPGQSSYYCGWCPILGQSSYCCGWCPILGQSSCCCRWCPILVMAPEMQEEEVISGNVTIYAYMSICFSLSFRSDATAILVTAPEMQEESLYKFILIFMSVS